MRVEIVALKFFISQRIMKRGHWQWLKRLLTLIEIPAPDPPRLLRRIEITERDIMLPLKAVAIVIIFYSFVSTPWFGLVLSTLDIAVETVQYVFMFLRAGQCGICRVVAEHNAAAIGNCAMDGGHKQLGGRTFHFGNGAVDRRSEQHFILVVCGLDRSQCDKYSGRRFHNSF